MLDAAHAPGEVPFYFERLPARQYCTLLPYTTLFRSYLDVRRVQPDQLDCINVRAGRRVFLDRVVAGADSIDVRIRSPGTAERAVAGTTVTRARRTRAAECFDSTGAADPRGVEDLVDV